MSRGAVRESLERIGLRPSRRLGQNFLVDPNLADAIVADAALVAGEVVLEVGPGLGALTERLLAAGHDVVAAEADPRLADELRETLAGGRLTLVVGDAMATKHKIAPALLQAIGHVTAGWTREFVLVANLPYSISVPLLVSLVLADPAPRRLTATVQREVALRLAAAPGSPDYGAATVCIQAFADVEVLRRVPPDVFHPRPRVESAVVAVVPRPAAELAELPPPVTLRQVTQAAFQRRRRRLEKAAQALWPSSPASAIRALFEELGLDPGIRPERVPPAGFIALARRLVSGTSP